MRYVAAAAAAALKFLRKPDLGQDNGWSNGLIRPIPGMGGRPTPVSRVPRLVGWVRGPGHAPNSATWHNFRRHFVFSP